MNDGDPRAAAELPTGGVALLSLFGVGWLAALPMLWRATRDRTGHKASAGTSARVLMLTTPVWLALSAVSMGSPTWTALLVVHLALTALVLGQWFIQLARPGSELRQRALTLSLLWVGLVLATPLMALAEAALFGWIGLYVVPALALGALLMARTGQLGQQIAMAAPLADRGVLRAWMARNRIVRKGNILTDGEREMVLNIDDSQAPTRTRLEVVPARPIGALTLRRGSGVGLGDVVLDELLESPLPSVAAKVLAGQHDAMLPALHGEGLRIEEGRVRGEREGALDADWVAQAWELARVLDRQAKKLRLG